jgi:hypothetical protein
MRGGLTPAPRKVIRIGSWVGKEELLDPLAEQPGQPECQGQARIVSPGFDGVHRLPRHLKTGRQIPLGPSVLRPELAQSVPH